MTDRRHKLSRSAFRDDEDFDDVSQSESETSSSSSSEYLDCKAEAATSKKNNDDSDDDDLLDFFLGAEAKTKVLAGVVKAATITGSSSSNEKPHDEQDVNALARDLDAQHISEQRPEPLPTPLILAARTYAQQGLILSVDNPDERTGSRADACQNVVLDLLRRATQSVHLFMYSINNFAIAHALTRCAQRGIDVVIYLDKGQAMSQKKNAAKKNEEIAKYNVRIANSSNNRGARRKDELPCIHEMLKAGGCEVILRGGCDRNSVSAQSYAGQMHMKALFLDYSVIVSGSYNYTLSARDQNFEHICVQIVSDDVAIANITTATTAHLANLQSYNGPKPSQHQKKKKK